MTGEKRAQIALPRARSCTRMRYPRIDSIRLRAHDVRRTEINVELSSTCQLYMMMTSRVMTPSLHAAAFVLFFGAIVTKGQHMMRVRCDIPTDEGEPKKKNN